MKLPKERIIFDNYDLWETYPDETLKEIALECGWVDSEDEITENDLMNWRYEESNENWEIAMDELESYFDGRIVGFFGEVGLWHGVYKAGKIGYFKELLYKAIEDCDYIKIYDKNGHLYLSCSHHDGTNCFEIKLVSDQGKRYLKNWEYNWNDKRKESYVYGQIYKRHSILPRFAERVYGCKARETEEVDKSSIINRLASGARSNYC